MFGDMSRFNGGSQPHVSTSLSHGTLHREDHDQEHEVSQVKTPGARDAWLYCCMHGAVSPALVPRGLMVYDRSWVVGAHVSSCISNVTLWTPIALGVTVKILHSQCMS